MCHISFYHKWMMEIIKKLLYPPASHPMILADLSEGRFFHCAVINRHRAARVKTAAFRRI
jgi:hypothetical protein